VAGGPQIAKGAGKVIGAGAGWGHDPYATTAVDGISIESR
jgi:hypothetical protein